MRDKQSLFVRLIGVLIAYAYGKGYEFTFGDAWRPDGKGHVANSFHYIRLAIDLNLFVNGEYKDTDCDEWQDLGAYWKGLNEACTWGGDFKQVDLNHFSLGEGQ